VLWKCIWASQNDTYFSARGLPQKVAQLPDNTPTHPTAGTIADGLTIVSASQRPSILEAGGMYVLDAIYSIFSESSTARSRTEKTFS
jgi:hypothetical protein